MTDPFKATAMIQNAILDAWVQGGALAFRSVELFIDIQDRLTHQVVAMGRCRPEIDDGPTFTGKYGRRRFDIDPEHDV